MIINNHNPKVSVIIGTRNRAKLLPRAIKSVLNQTYEDFECIVVDDGSSDNTPNVVKSFKDERILYIKQLTNNGRVPSINRAIKKSCGSFITFLDDDDEYLPTKLQKQVALFETLPEEIGLVYCWMDYYDDSTGEIIRERHPAIKGDIYSEMLAKQSIAGFPTLMIRSNVFEKIGLYNENIEFHSDWMMACMVSRDYEVNLVPEVLVKVYENHGYDRLSKIKYDNKKSQKILLRFYIYILQEFRDGFRKYPKQKFNHLLSISRLYANLGKFNKSLYYSLLAIRLKPYNIKGYKRFAGGLIKFILGNSFYNNLRNKINRFHKVILF